LIRRTLPPRGHRVAKHAEIAVFHNVADIGELKAEAQVRLVRAKAVHGLPPGHAPEGGGHVHVQHLFEHSLDEALWMAMMSSSSMKLISRSIWVNSGWRSARRSSSRKHRAIWK
jgi:hypothetical protein